MVVPVAVSNKLSSNKFLLAFNTPLFVMIGTGFVGVGVADCSVLPYAITEFMLVSACATFNINVQTIAATTNFNESKRRNFFMISPGPSQKFLDFLFFIHVHNKKTKVFLRRLLGNLQN